MSDREDKKLNLGDELADVKSLIAGAEDGGFSLDDILAEYGVKSPPGRSAIPLRPSPPEETAPTCPGRRPPVPVGTETTWWPSQGEELYLRRRTAPPPRISPSRRRALRSPKGRPRRQTPSWMPKKTETRLSSFPRRRALWPPSSRTSAKRRMTTPTVCLRSRSRWTQRRSAAWRP